MPELDPNYVRIYLKNGGEAIVNRSTAAEEVAAGRASYEKPPAKAQPKKETAK